MNLEVQLSKTDPSEALRRYISRRLHFSLGRFGGRVGRLDVRIVGTERMRGNQNHCRIDAEIVPFGHVTIQETNPDMYVAIDRATTRIGRLFARNWNEFEIFVCAARLCAQPDTKSISSIRRIPSAKYGECAP